MKKAIAILLSAVLAAPMLPAFAQDDTKPAQKKRQSRAEHRREVREERREARREKAEARRDRSEARREKRREAEQSK